MARPRSVPEQVREFFDRHAMPAPGLLVAVSGGADSVALLHACRQISLQPLIVAHVHHGLRGAASDDDARFVEDLAASMGLPFRLVRLDADKLRAGGNLQAAARTARYAALKAMAVGERVRSVATAHSADDLAETVLHRLIRGTGLYGLAGIPARRSLGDGVTVVRPLLTVTRSEIEEYLRGLNQRWREDATNRDEQFMRSRLRSRLLPLLRREYNPRVTEALVRLANQAARWRHGEARRWRRRLARIERPRAGEAVVLDRAALSALRPEALADLLAGLWRRERWSQAAMGQYELLRLARWCLDPTAAMELPGGVSARRHDQTIALSGHRRPLIESKHE